MVSRGAAAAALTWGKKAGAGAGSGGHGHQNQTTSIPRHILSAIVLGIAVTTTATTKLLVQVTEQASKSSPNLWREIFYVTNLGIFGGAFWKVHHLNERRKTEEFYARLEAEITVAVE